MPGKSKIYIFAGGHKVAEGSGTIEPNGKFSSAPAPETWGKEDADPMQNVKDALADIPVFKFPKVAPKLTFNLKIPKKNVSRFIRKYMGGKNRLPRKLKKAARHTEFDVFDMSPMVNSSTDPKNVIMQMYVDYRLTIRPASYPRTRWVQRLVNLWKREMEGKKHS